MKIFAKKLQEQLEIELNKVGYKGKAINGYTACIKLVESAIGELKSYLVKHPFKDTAEEIFYFKNIAPFFYSRHIYFVKVCDAELSRNASTKKLLSLFLESEEKEIEKFYHKYGEFCLYIYMDMSSHDEDYFTRGIPKNWVQDDVTIIMDENFSLASYRLSRLRAYEEYKLFLEKEKAKLENNLPPEDNHWQERIYTWEGTDAQLTEVIYGFKGKGSIKVNGRVMDIKDYEIMCNDLFKKKLDHVYITHFYNQRRKKDKTPYLNSMIQIITGTL